MITKHQYYKKHRSQRLSRTRDTSARSENLRDIRDASDDLNKAILEYNFRSNNLHLNEIRHLSSELIRLKKEHVLTDSDFEKIITLVFSNYLENKIKLLVNEKIEKKLNDMFMSLAK